MSLHQLPHLTTKQIGRKLVHFDSLDTTNNYCKEHADQLPDGAVVIADQQTAGKGSKGRSWSADKGQCLAMSVLCKDITPEKLPLLSLLAGMAVSRALELLCGVPFPIKWSNDVLCEGKKVCGILCEGRTSGSSSYAVMGIGVNLLQNREDFDRHGLVYAQSLYLVTGKVYTFDAVAAVICNHLEPVLSDFRKNGFSDELRNDYQWRCYTLGRQIRINGERVATAVDVGKDGSLLCNCGGQLINIHSGEVSVRGLYGYA